MGDLVLLDQHRWWHRKQGSRRRFRCFDFFVSSFFAAGALRTLRGRFLAFFFVLLLLSACSLSPPNAYVRKGFGQSQIGKVAVFPFYNNTNVPEASNVVTGAFIASLLEKAIFHVEFPGNVRSFLVSERIVVRTGVDLETIKLMGKRLGVDAVVLGRVEEYIGAQEATRAVVPVVSVSTRIVDARTGKILFMAKHRRTGDDYIKVLDFGKIRSAGELTKKMVAEIIETMPDDK